MRQSSGQHPSRMSRTPNRRYHAVAQKLETVPPELVHKVLDDLPLIKTLEVICAHNVPYVDTCVLSHIHLAKVFPSPASLIILKQYFALYIELCRRRESPSASGNPDIPLLAKDLVVFMKQQYTKTSRYDTILAAVKAEVLSLLEKYEPYLPALAKFAPRPVVGGIPDLSDPAALWDFWTNLEAAETSLNRTKSSQLQRIARLRRDYPGTLRNRRDTSQESRYHSEQHCIRQLEVIAKRMLKPQILRGKLLGKHIFSEQRFPVLPYDRYLKCFLKVLEKFPVEGVSSSSNTGKHRAVRAYAWPQEVAQDIRTVVDGMAYVYPKTSVEGLEYSSILRTKYTRYSRSDYCRSEGQSQPRFLDGSKDDGQQESQSRLLSDNDNILPLQEKEFEWLEAFLRSCRYMGKMDDADSAHKSE
ncbi:hypothetical protein LshimejAT787_0307440 [Lyophyllum shimeji]|uniref:Uncharacterized protein n=1 Tax=Lyophyllum shimeji TaxID=47721 RepID=A0A9P3PIL0_LYOSH|nr:hypothetical protein LshimejAT787_0307440 [Lyophyllum shimeji]